MKLFQSLFFVLTAILVTACSGVNFSEWRFPYMYPVQQGNYITQQQLSSLRLGMTKDQVASQVGTPVSQFMFESSQWQYVYQQYKNDKLINSYIVNVNFNKNDQLQSLESSGGLFNK